MWNEPLIKRFAISAATPKGIFHPHYIKAGFLIIGCKLKSAYDETSIARVHLATEWAKVISVFHAKRKYWSISAISLTVALWKREKRRTAKVKWKMKVIRERALIRKIVRHCLLLAVGARWIDYRQLTSLSEGEKEERIETMAIWVDSRKRFAAKSSSAGKVFCFQNQKKSFA